MLSEHVKSKVSQWEAELREITHDDLRLMVTKNPELNLTLEEVAEIVIYVTGIPLEKVKHKIRKRNIVTSRHLIAYYARTLSNIPWKEIGAFLGGRDHTTAIHGYQSIRDLLESGNTSTVNTVARINTYLEAFKKKVKEEN